MGLAEKSVRILWQTNSLVNKVIKNIERFQSNFYSVESLGINIASPKIIEQWTVFAQNGPFGFDIHKAYDFCSIIESNDIDTIIETGTNAGDTTEFLAKQYPDKKIITCETDPSLVTIARLRLDKFKNVSVFEASSEFIVRDVNQDKHNIIYFLDAHFQAYWPLKDELHLIKRGFVMIDDFCIGSSNYYYDTYDKVKCDINLIKLYAKPQDAYVNNVLFHYPLPNHQKYFVKSGRGFYQKGFSSKVFLNKNFRRVV